VKSACGGLATAGQAVRVHLGAGWAGNTLPPDKVRGPQRKPAMLAGACAGGLGWRRTVRGGTVLLPAFVWAVVIIAG